MRNQEAVDRIMRTARRWLGTPYRHQASLRGVGCDCIGLVRGVWRETEGHEPVNIPAYSSAWSEVSDQELLLDAARHHFVEIPGHDAQEADVVVFRLRSRSAAKHVGILSGQDRFIHAYDGNAVVENALSEFWKSRIVGTFRFPDVHLEDSRKWRP